MRSTTTDELRRIAEARLQAKTMSVAALPVDDTQKMLHELHVHQIELEMQCEALRDAKRENELVLYRYTELFDFAPIGYFALYPNSEITQVNLRGASLMGLKESNLIGRRFLIYVTQEHRVMFSDFLAKAFETGDKQNCEILVQVDEHTLWLSVEANIGVTEMDCLVSISDITALKENEIALTEAALEVNAELVFQKNALDEHAIVSIADVAGDITYVNDKFCAISGYDREELLGNNHKVVKSDEHPDGFFVDMWKTISSGHAWHGEIKNTNKTGIDYWVKTTIVPTLDDRGKPFQYVGIRTEVTERKQAEENLHTSEQRFSSLVHSQSDLICRLNVDGILTFANDSYISFMGNGKSELLGHSIYQHIPPKEHESVKATLSQLSVEQPRLTHENSMVSTAGENRIFEWINHGLFDSNQALIEIQSVGRDVTEVRESQNEVLQAHDKLERIAHFDILTNLPNRSLLADRLSHSMLQCSRSQQSLAVAFLDLDGFKAVNDLHGHELGDKLLIALSLRMKEALRESDTLARFGGDEFVAVLADLTSFEDCEPLLERLLLAASEPVTVGDVVLNVSASIGVTLYPRDNVNADQLMRHADQAMYVAKESGKNRYHIFDTAQDDAVKVQRESLEAIRNGLDNHQFVLHYQPKVNMRTGMVIGFEALIRWQHPKRGLLNPIDFLPVIEHHTMMIEMGEWVIDSALIQISQWQGLGRNLPFSTSVNIAALQLQQPDFTDRLATLLAAHPDVEPRYLELEVLETSALNDVQYGSTIMNACMALGVSFALDDFGTGYSSLTYLRCLPTGLIKIDQSFVGDMLTDSDDLAIVDGVIALAKSFKRDVVAEGVETIGHGAALLDLGCELGQGYGIARPMPAGDIPEWVSSWKPDDSWRLRPTELDAED